MINREEAELLGRFTRDDCFQIDLYSNFLELVIPVFVSFEDTELKVLSDISLNCINAFLALDKKHLQWIHDEIWKGCLLANGEFTATHNGETRRYTLEDNLMEYGILTKIDAIEKTVPHSIFIVNNWNIGKENTFFYLNYKCAWDDEHQLTFYFKNGQSYGVD